MHLTDCAKLFLADISGLCQIQSYKSILEIHLLDIEEQNYYLDNFPNVVMRFD